MKIFTSVYERAMKWATHRHAPWYLGGLSFVESCVLPFPPPDVMLAPMALSNTQRAWRFAMITTVLSVLGGLMGYLIGQFAFDLVQPWLEKAGYMGKYDTAVGWFSEWGVWVVLLAGFSPIPYKLFTIAAGVISMALIPFILASIAGRGARFFLVAGLMVLGGEKMEKALHENVDKLGYATITLAVVAYLLIKYV